MPLSRRFSPLVMLLFSINGMVGSAWLFSALYSAKIAGPAAIVSWFLGGGATILIALTFAELSTMLPVTGGVTRFFQITHGSLTNMIISWISWLSCLIIPPLEVQATLQYASTYYPPIAHIVNGTSVLTPLGLGFATILMTILCILNIASFKGLVRSNFLLFIYKIFVIIAIIGFFMKTRFHPTNFIGTFPSFFSADWKAIFTAVATGGIAFAFAGFTHGVALAGESKNAQFGIPFAVIGSVIFCLLLYVGLQAAFIGVVEPSSIQNGWSQLSFSGQSGPFVGLATALGLFWLVKLIYVDTVVSPLGTGLIYVTSTARIVFAMSKNGYFPAVFSKVNQAGFPVWAIILNFVVGLFLFLPLPGWQEMVSFFVSLMVISYIVGPICLLCMRLQLPLEKRYFRMPLVYVMTPLAFYFCNLIVYWTGWDILQKSAIAITIGFFILLIAFFRGLIDKKHFGLRSIVWLLPYFIGIFSISYLGTFGGKGYISTGMDFLVIGIFSIVTFILAILTRQKDASEQFQIYLTESKTLSS
ncbi:MAG: APC family permease [Proteobacteria bacterium]|nr:APC family permease [Pseudomonadota bacterium]